MVAALQEADASGLDVDRIALERPARELVADGNGQRGLILRKLAGVARMQIEIEEIDGVLLRARPQRFARDIGADRGHHLQAESGDRRLQQNDRDERRNELDDMKEASSLR